MDVNREGINSDKLVLILNDLDNNSVAIKGSKVFSLTYSLAGNVSTYLYSFKSTYKSDS